MLLFHIHINARFDH